MNRSARLASFLSLALLTGCVTFDTEYISGTDRHELATVTRPDGSREKYVLEVGRGQGEAGMQIVTEYDRKRPFLGVRAMDLDRAEAERRGVRPYQGILVTGTYPRSAAEAAGITAGDVLLALDGQPTVYADQLAKVEARLQVGKAVTARVLRGQAETDVSVTPAGLEEHVVDPQSIPLDSVQTQKPYSGLILRGIPRAWADRMFGDARNGVVVSGVDVGSPAWVAGFRGGDLLEAVDGGVVPPLADLTQAIQQKGARGESLALAVRRDGAVHQASIQLADYRPTRQVWVPLIAHVQNGYYEDKWSVGPFGLICNNKNRYLADATTREPKTKNVFNAILGLIRVETGGNDPSLRLLWLIDIDL